MSAVVAPGPETSTGTAPPPVPPPATVPPWFVLGLTGALAAVAAGGALALALAVAGWFHPFPPLLAAVGAAVTAVVATVVSGAGRRDGPVAPGAVGAAVLAVVVASVSVAGNGWATGEHRLTDRDPGVYAATAEWIATEGDLVVDAGEGPFGPAAAAGDVLLTSQGFYDRGDGTVEPQFNHLAPSLVAVASRVGGDGAARVLPAALLALGLLAVHAVAARATGRPWLAAAAMTALAVSMPFLAVARGPYSEPVALALLWGGAWAWTVGADHRHQGWALFAGLLLGLTVAARVDAAVHLLPVPVVLALAVPLVRRRGGTGTRARAGALLLGLVPGVALGLADLALRSRGYVEFHASQVTLLGAGLVAAIAAAVAGRVLARRRPGLVSAVLGRRDALAVATGVCVGALLLALWLVRPELQQLRGTDSALITTLQAEEGVALDGTRRYGEQALHWLSWYVGPLTLLGGAVGAGLVARRGVAGDERSLALVWAALGAGLLLYVWQPSIFPDQVWATRRFVPAGLPLLVVLAAVAVAAGLDRLAERGRAALAPVLLVLAAAALVVPPAVVSWPVRAAADQRGAAAFVDELCVAVDGAAVVTVDVDVAGLVGHGALRSWCGVPVASVAPEDVGRVVPGLAERWAAEGRGLVAVVSDPGILDGLAPGAAATTVGPVTDDRAPQDRLLGAPSSYATDTLTWYVAPLTP